MNNTYEFYKRAKQKVIDLGYENEIVWQTEQSPDHINEQTFLQEAAWVIYCSGFREETVRQHFNLISLCFCDWESAETIAKKKIMCISSAMCVFKNSRKHCAVAEVADIISNHGFANYKKKLNENTLETLQQLPFIGKITSYHLAKNLGFDIAKPDRHLTRLTKYFGYDNVNTLCKEISCHSGDPVRVVDLILWRYLERQQMFKEHIV
ncbi:MAG: hypothetical protein LBV04_05545 [Deferribacteraceae bacterium]|jgi:hypothetical protein|nr:hypothetical protein [Deferribacteraceae bacterium]